MLTFPQAVAEILGMVIFIVVLILILTLVPSKPKRLSAQWRVRDGKTDRALDDTDEGKLYKEYIAKDICPDCRSTNGFYDGPNGGMSQNIFCQNRECRSGFSVTVFDQQGNGTAERIGKGDLARYPEGNANA